ncbi:MAG TPA: gephyrin-like molybdotransferase Glp [Bacteroidota bacterium]|nr:gephyrin-like molybdotransferase Glp [Bacteroidota bacterium]
MLEYLEACEKILRHAHRMMPRRVPLADALGLNLAQEVKAREPIPLFDSSSVDGYAVLAADLKEAASDREVRLPVSAVIPAGSPGLRTIRRGETMKIMTGAPLPRKADAVVMKEHVREVNGVAIFTSPAKEGENLRRRGDEFAKGETVFVKGANVTPPVIAMSATLGFATLNVFAEPSVALVITGSEVRSPSAPLKRGQIRDANSYLISATLQHLGLSRPMILRARDSKRELKKAFARAIKKADVVISAGGVSVGDFDYVKEILSDLRVKTVFWRVAMKPGKPNYFGTRGGKLIFGLPGNPVSALVSFEVLVLPALHKMMGSMRMPAITVRAELAEDVKRSSGRVEFVRAFATRLPDGRYSVHPVIGQGSHMVSGVARANCLIVLSQNNDRVKKGDLVEIRFLSWTGN